MHNCSLQKSQRARCQECNEEGPHLQRLTVLIKKLLYFYIIKIYSSNND